MRRRLLASIACVLMPVAFAADDPSVNREQLNATLWMQRAPEYRAIAEQTYKLAAERIAAPVPGSAALEQVDVPADALARMPTAVIMDLDETVLDNSVYQARLLRDRAPYDQQSWGEWVRMGQAEAVPGAPEFIAAARRLGHTVFFLSNRDCKVPPASGGDPCPAKTSTLRNLVALGIGPAPDPEHLLLRNERAEWNVGSKVARRAFIAKSYRVVALVGDDLGDFVDPMRYAGDRARLEPRFGSTWFVLPNAMYGSWTNAFDEVAEKYAALRAEPAVLTLPNGAPWKGGDRVRVATWNVEYLLTPETSRGLKATCAEQGGMVGGDDRTLPCAITKRDPRTPEDFASLRNYANTLNADIVALQEVDGPDAAALVFPGYEYCFTTRAHTQKNGFAIRRGLPFRCEPEYAPLGLPDNSVRRGVVVTFFPGTQQEFRLMSVHLKSGCPEGPLTAPGRNCELLAKQVAPLEQWIDDEARAGRRFGLLGDFNRRFTKERGPARDADGRQLNVFAEINDGDPAAAQLTSIASINKFSSCTRDSEYREYIDDLLLGRDLAKNVVRKSFVRVVFNDEDAKQRWLSDHCPVGIELRLR
jgi:5'-nucleotidase (lipoprotein e(P4) family)